MNIHKRPQLFLIVFTILSILCFATVSKAQAQERWNKGKLHELVSPGTSEFQKEEYRNGPYIRRGEPINEYEPGVYKMHIDGMRPPNEPGYSGIGCDSRQDPALYMSNINNRLDSVKSWETGSCMENGKPCCVNIDLAGYQIPPTDPRYVISERERKICEDPDSFQGPPGMREMEMQRLKPVCDVLAQRGNAPPAGNGSGMPPMGNVSGMPPMGNDAQRRFDEAKAAREQAEQKVTELETALEEAKQTLTLALDEEKAAKEALDQQGELLVAAQAALEQARQRFTEAQTALEAAQASQQEAQQTVDAAQAKVKELGG